MASTRVGPPVEGLTTVEIDDCVSVYNPATESMVALNETASAIWRLITGERDLGQIVRELADAYGVDPAQIEAEVEQTVAQLRAAALLREPAEPSGD